MFRACTITEINIRRTTLTFCVQLIFVLLNPFPLISGSNPLFASAYSDSLRVAAIHDTIYTDSLTFAISSAAANNDVDTIRTWLDAGGNVSALDSSDLSLLYYAASGNAVDVGKLLIECGGDINQQLRYGTPLHRAAVHDRLEVLRLFLQHNPDFISPNRFGNPLLHQVSLLKENPKVIQLLVENGADMFMIDSSGLMGFHKAAQWNAIENLKTYLKLGFPIDQKDANGHTALHHAFTHNHIIRGSRYSMRVRDFYPNSCFDKWELITFLRSSGAKLENLDISDYSLLFFITEYDSINLFKEVIKLGGDIFVTDKYSNSLLHIAAQFNSLNIAKYLLKYDVPLEIVSMWHYTPLLRACMTQQSEVTKLLLEHGADINLQLPLRNTHIAGEPIYDGYSCLHFAVHFNNIELAKLLIEHGADLDLLAIGNTTPLLLALSKGYNDMFDLLLQAGANPNIVGSYKRETALHFAVRTGNLPLVKQLVKAGALVGIANSYGKYPIDVIQANHKNAEEIEEFLLENHGDINRLTDSGRTPLQEAVKKQDITEIKRLIALGADPNYRNKEQETIIYSHFSAEELNLDVIEVLLKNGADPNVVDIYNTSPLQLAFRYRSLETIKLLLQYGADINFPGNQLEELRLQIARYKYEKETHWSNPNPGLYRDEIKWHPVLADWFWSPLDNESNEEENTKTTLLYLEEGGEVDQVFNYGKKTTLLWEALLAGYVDAAEILIEHGALINNPQLDSEPIFRILFSTSESTIVDALKLVLENGADPNTRDQYDNTPLFIACQNVRVNDKLGIVKTLIEHGANVNVKCRDFETPLHQATYRKYHDVMVELLKAGANPDARSRTGMTPYKMATQQKDSVGIKLIKKYR